MNKHKIQKTILILAIMSLSFWPTNHKVEADEINGNTTESQSNKAVIEQKTQCIDENIEENVEDSIKAVDTSKITYRYVTATAYSSTPDQTDSTPFITANGSRVHDGTLAANFLPFGAKVRLPEYSGDKVYTVEDRMNRRFPDRIDLWFPTRTQAFAFGKRQVKIEVQME